MSTKTCDVTISVWNDFWSPQLASGLHSAGFQVTHHTTARQKTPCARFIRNTPASALNHLAFRGALPTQFAYLWSRRFVDSEGARLARDSKAFWGWSGCSLAGLQTAKSTNRLAVLERGSTHCLWNQSKVLSVYKSLNLPLDEVPTDKEMAYDLAEYRNSDFICVPSRFVFNSFLEYGIPAERLNMNPYGADFDFWSNCGIQDRSNHIFTFLWVATLMPRKGIHTLLDAWRKAALGDDFRLLLVGGISKSAKSILHNLPAGVLLDSHLDHFGIREVMSRSHIYVLPSFEEGMARSVLEAAAAALPTIITNETGATDILKDGVDCWVVPSGDSEALAETFKFVAQNPDIAKARGLHAQSVMKEYTWDAYGKRAANFLKPFLT